jgi:hypothetical protein
MWVREAVNVMYLFKYCVEARCETAVPADVWARSVDERLIEHEASKDLDGYVWGVKWQALYPGAKVVTDSPRAAQWAQALGIDFHEVRIETSDTTSRWCSPNSR